MHARNRSIVFALAAVHVDSSARASCTLDVSAIEVRIDSCRPATEYAEERLEGQFGWVRELVTSVLQGEKSVVVAGHVLREARVELVDARTERLAETKAVSRDEVWVLGPKGATCSVLLEGTVWLFLAPRPCCDVLPPYAPTCLLEIGSIEPLSAELSAEFGNRAPETNGGHPR